MTGAHEIVQVEDMEVIAYSLVISPLLSALENLSEAFYNFVRLCVYEYHYSFTYNPEERNNLTTINTPIGT